MKIILSWQPQTRVLYEYVSFNQRYGKQYNNTTMDSTRASNKPYMAYNLPKKTGEYQSHKVFLAYDWLKEWLKLIEPIRACWNDIENIPA